MSALQRKLLIICARHLAARDHLRKGARDRFHCMDGGVSSVLRAVQPSLILKGEEDDRALIINRKQGVPPTRALSET